MPRPPAAQRDGKSKFDTAHVTSGHLEVLYAKFHDRTTSQKIVPPACLTSSCSRFQILHSAHETTAHLEVLHTKFHDRVTSNLGK